MSGTATIGKATSKDGTIIGWEQSGSGPTLVLVHGTTADRTRWAPVLPGLSEHFTVVAVDRRGRGLSGETSPYSVEREFEDLVAVVESFPEPVHLLGHSYGGMVALGAAQVSANVRSLVLYEGGGPTPTDLFPREPIDQIAALIDEGRREEALAKFMGEIVGLPAEQLELLRSLPAWQARIAAAHTLTREMKVILDGEYQFDPEAFGSFKVPTLLLMGSDSPAYAITETEALHSAIPGSRIAVMAGQQHAAMDTGTGIFLTQVIAFLLAN